MRKVLTIAYQTVTSYGRDRVFHGFLVFSLLLIGFSFLLSTLTIVDPGKILIDFALSAISLMGVMLSLFIGVTVVGWEIERRTIYTILSKPVTRVEYLLGKFLGGLAVNVMMHILSYFTLLFVIYEMGEVAPPGLPQAVLLVAMESSIVLALALFLSLCLSSSFLVASVALAIFLMGRSASSLRVVQQRLESGAAKQLVRALHDIIPSLERFNIREVVAYGKPYPEGLVGQSSLYFLAYVGFLLGVSFLAFRRKDLR